MDPLNDKAAPVIRPLSAALQAIAIEELNEDPQRIVDDILHLRLWIQQQPHLRARTNDQFLLAFLRGSKWSLQRAKQKIDRYYSLKASIPEIFNEKRVVDDSMALEIIRLGTILQIPMPMDYTGPCITIIRAGSYDTNKYKFGDIVRVGSMFGEIMMIEDDNSNVSGYVEIMDMSRVTGTHFFQLQPDLVRKFQVFAVEAMPMRHRGTHFINVPTAFELGFKTLRGFFPSKMVDRITVTHDIESIHNRIPKHLLPFEYGGENSNMHDIIKTMEAKIMKYGEYFRNEHKYGSDEKLRESNNKFGFHQMKIHEMEGSFRKINID